MKDPWVGDPPEILWTHRISHSSHLDHRSGPTLWRVEDGRETPDDLPPFMSMTLDPYGTSDPTLDIPSDHSIAHLFEVPEGTTVDGP